MKIKTRPDDADMLESNELFQMNGWLAELRDDGRAESWDEDRSGVEENGYPKPRVDGRAESQDGGRASSPQDSRTGSRNSSPAESRNSGRAGSRNGSRADSRGEGHRRPPDDGHAGPGRDGRARPRDDSQAGPRGDSRRAPWDEQHAGPGENGRARPRDDGQARPRDDGQARPWDGYPRPEALAAPPVTTPVTSTKTTARAVIGDQLRLPIMWCEMVTCISWFAHPAALGEADIRARAIDAGWRVDAVGLLFCPQCVQTAPGYRSPLPVAVWDREEAMTMSAQMADEPSAELVASVAQELSHDLRCPASDHRDEVGAASAWIAGVPADDVARSASRGTSLAAAPADDVARSASGATSLAAVPADEVARSASGATSLAAVPADEVARSASGGTSGEVRRLAGDRRPEHHPRPGRHRKRLVARLTFASH